MIFFFLFFNPLTPDGAIMFNVQNIKHNCLVRELGLNTAGLLDIANIENEFCDTQVTFPEAFRIDTHMVETPLHGTFLLFFKCLRNWSAVYCS